MGNRPSCGDVAYNCYDNGAKESFSYCEPTWFDRGGSLSCDVGKPLRYEAACLAKGSGFTYAPSTDAFYNACDGTASAVEGAAAFFNELSQSSS